MKKIFEYILAILIGGSIAYGIIFLIGKMVDADNASTEREKAACKAEGNIWTDWEKCENKYEYCLSETHYAFGGLTDTIWVSQNNADAISKSMRDEITRCLEIR